MMSVELKHHPEEWFFLHNFDIDRVFSTIQRADYLILYYIKMQAEQHPDRKVYLADLAAVMGLKVTELSKAVEKLQDKGFVAWKTDREAGRTYVELSSKAVELMCDTDLPISDIIAAVGYENNSYFHRVFKERYGVTPRAFRVANQKNDKVRL